MATIIEELRQRVQLERRLIARLKTANIRFTDAGQSSQPIKLAYRFAKSLVRPD